MSGRPQFKKKLVGWCIVEASEGLRHWAVERTYKKTRREAWLAYFKQKHMKQMFHNFGFQYTVRTCIAEGCRAVKVHLSTD